jgi:hypothetical protein
VPLALASIIIPEMMVMAEVFWGLWLIPMGTLVIKSKQFPKIIGYALYAGALGYLGGVITTILLGTKLAVIEAGTFGELIWVLWITIMGAKKK